MFNYGAGSFSSGGSRDGAHHAHAMCGMIRGGAFKVQCITRSSCVYAWGHGATGDKGVKGYPRTLQVHRIRCPVHTPQDAWAAILKSGGEQ